MCGIFTRETINPSGNTISQSTSKYSGEKERIAIHDDALGYAEHCICSHLHIAQVTHWEAERFHSAVRSCGSCGLFIVTIINKPNACMYTRPKDTLIALTNQNQLSQPEKEIRLEDRKKEGRREWTSHRRETACVAMGAKAPRPP